MSHYIEMLKAEVRAQDEADRARDAAEVELNRVAAIDAARDRMKPLDVRLARVLATIPAEAQREGLSLLALAERLKGRRGGTAQTGALGLALRRLGWTRTRSWRGGADGGFSALWFPPGRA